MTGFKNFPKGEVKRSFHFYGWTIGAAILVLFGVITIITGKVISRDNVPPLEGLWAYLAGIFFICSGLFILHYLFFKAEKYEKQRSGFHELDNFEDIVDGYNSSFEINQTSLPSINNSTIHVFYYILKIEFKKRLPINIYIKQRDKLEYFFWKIGITRFLDILTGYGYFDSKYRVKTTGKKMFKRIFDQHVIGLLDDFDRNYPPVRDKNGTLVLTDSSIKYIEGPYQEEQRLFDPHRGKIEDVFLELVKIAKAIEYNVNL